MTIQAQLYSALVTVCPRVFPDTAPSKTPRPFIIYQQIGGQVLNPLDNSAPGKINGRFQITVWAPTRKQAAEMIQAVEDMLRAHPTFIARPEAAAIEDNYPDVSLYASIQDFSIWADA